MNLPLALVTGATRGIGRAIALRLASQGFAVVANYRSSHAEAQSLAEEITNQGGQVHLAPFDVANREETFASLTELETRLGAFYCLVLNAGISKDYPLPALEPDAWDQVIQTNLTGTYNCIKPLINGMLRAKKGGRIVTLSSVSGLTGNRGQCNYASTKAGLIGLTKSLAQEMGKRRITVNAVAPGLITTEMTKDLDQDMLLQMIPLRRFGQPEEVAALVGFLCGPEAEYITGQVLSINGGLA